MTLSCSGQTKLAVGKSISYTIKAQNFQNKTSVLLEEGKMYKITVPENDTWFDDYIETNADGYTSNSPKVRDDISRSVLKTFEAVRRKPDADWFCLIGELNPLPSLDNFIFKIGISRVIAIPKNKSGVLHLWANDVTTRYSNNHGSIRVTIKRIQ